MKKTIVLALFALLVVASVFGVVTAAESSAGTSEGALCLEGGNGLLLSCTYYCPWCPQTGYSCNAGGSCC